MLFKEKNKNKLLTINWFFNFLKKKSISFKQGPKKVKIIRLKHILTSIILINWKEQISVKHSVKQSLDKTPLINQILMNNRLAALFCK